MPRTTLALDDDLLEVLKTRAAKEKRTAASVANDLIRLGLVTEPRPNYRLDFPTWTASTRPGVDLSEQDKILELMEID